MKVTSSMGNSMDKGSMSGPMVTNFPIWKNGKKDGNGCFSRPNGFVFIGLFSDDVPNGKGFYIGPDGTTFSGNWKGGEQNGHGILRDNDESIVYYGPWKNGAPTNFIS